MHVAINYSIQQIAEITNGNLIQQAYNSQPSYLLLDSRKLIYPSATVFFAINNTHKSADLFIGNLYKKGVRDFVTGTSINVKKYTGANFILVDDTLKALQKLAAYHRQKFNIPVIGITGSNGKTIVKEWLNQLLQNDFNIVRSPKSFNSQIGVPLSVLQVTVENTLAIFEAGISLPAEMQHLEKIILPTIGIFTNIGDAHNEGFKTPDEKISEKLQLFINSESVVYCSDYAKINEAIVAFKQHVNPRLTLINWSKNHKAFLQIISIEKQSSHTEIKARLFENIISIAIPFSDEASIENAINCWCVLLYLQMDNRIIANRMQQLFAIEMRLQLKQGINNCSVINDSYSADLNSLSIALDFLQHQHQHSKRTVILSDILQTGKSSDLLYKQVAELLHHKKIIRLIGIGPEISSQQNQFNFLKEKMFFDTADDFKNAFDQINFYDETILLKGARVFELEEISNLLEQKAHQTILSINLNAVAHNLKEYKNILRPDVKIMAMVKAFSYGSGSFEIANLLQFNNTDYLAVAYADEGVELRKAGVTLPIMVMNPEESTFDSLLKYELEPEIFSFSILQSFEKYLQSSAENHFPVHIKLDTGMHRLGFEQHEINLLADHLAKISTLKVESVFSHLVASEDEKQVEFTNRQAAIFKEGCKCLENNLGYTFLKHIANTSGITLHPNLQLDMVRLGIGLYGIDHDATMQSRLKNVSTLVTTVSQIKKVKQGESIGYGRRAVVTKDSTIATVRIGYADGYPRNLSNGRGKMLFGNTLVPVAGNVCMDMTMLDVSEVKNIKEGDEVIVFGEGLPVQQIAEWSDTISYEILTGISQRVKRVYYQE